MPFEDARQYVQKLSLGNTSDWSKWFVENNPIDIPEDPATFYKEEWDGWNNWLAPSTDIIQEAEKLLRGNLFFGDGKYLDKEKLITAFQKRRIQLNRDFKLPGSNIRIDLYVNHPFRGMILDGRLEDKREMEAIVKLRWRGNSTPLELKERE